MLVSSVLSIYVIHLNISIITVYRVNFMNSITHAHLVIPDLMNPVEAAYPCKNLVLR